MPRCRLLPVRIVAAVTGVVMVTSGCADPRSGGQTVVVTETVATVTGARVQGGVGAPPADAGVPTDDPVPSAAPAPARTADEGTGVDLSAVLASVAAPAGAAIAPVGETSRVETAGSWQSGVAWSTIKVPLAVAVARSDSGQVEAAASAITASDNQAAETLWAALGGGQAAASAVTTVLADGGDTVTRVPAVHTRAGYSIFGQTQWSLGDQARFAASLPCLPGAGRVVELMGQIAPDQRWGLGRIPGARFKGGWGPGEAGGYLVRQFGLVPASGGDTAVALAVEAPTFEAGTAALSAMADELSRQLPGVAAGAC